MGCTCWQSLSSYHLYSIRLGTASLTKVTRSYIQGQCLINQSTVHGLTVLKVPLRRPLPSVPPCWLREWVPQQYLIHASHQTTIAKGTRCRYMNLSSRLKLKMLSYTTVKWACASTQARKFNRKPTHLRLLPCYTRLGLTFCLAVCKGHSVLLHIDSEVQFLLKLWSSISLSFCRLRN